MFVYLIIWIISIILISKNDWFINVFVCSLVLLCLFLFLNPMKPFTFIPFSLFYNFFLRSISSKSILLYIGEITYVFSTFCKFISALTIFLIISILSFVLISICHGLFSLAVFSTVFIFTIVDIAFETCGNSFSIFLSIFPRAFVFYSVFLL